MKKGINIPLTITSVIAVCLVAIVAVLGIKAKNSADKAEAEPSSYGYENSLDYGTVTEDSTTAPSYWYNESAETSTTLEDFTNAASSTVKAAATTVKAAATTAATTVKTIVSDTGSTTKVVVAEDATIPVIEDATKSAAATVGTTVATSTLPKDMYLSGLYSLGYNVIGPKEFIYNDDTSDNCTQRAFGYNSLYDAGAALISFSIETTKIDFKYNSRSYRLQLWKGEYISDDSIGTVGGEVGLYARYSGKTYVGSHYDCADESDWVKMEMTIMWDEYDDGVYRPQLTRKYATHWWCTGYVDGQLKDKNDSNTIQILCRITFLDQDEATACVNSMVSKGFKRVSTFNPTVKDTVKQYGSDVIFLWEDIR